MELTKSLAVLLIFALANSIQAKVLEKRFGNTARIKIGEVMTSGSEATDPGPKTITFPENGQSGPHIITGFRQMEYGSNFPEIDIIKGGIGQTFIQFTVTAKTSEAFNSFFEFYGEPIY